MQITHIGATHFLNHRSLNIAVDPKARVLFVVGDNGSGKTGIAQGIKLALTGNPVRGLTYKNQLDTMITHGEKDGFFTVSILRDGEEEPINYRLSLKTGNYSGSSPELPGNALSLDPHAFVEMDAKERRKLLFQLAGIQMKPDVIIKDLVDAGHALERVQQIAPDLRKGFDAASEAAKSAATEARGGWKATTGETYGEKKAASWKAAVPKPEQGLAPRAKLEEDMHAAEKAVDAAKDEARLLRNAAEAHAAAAGATEAQKHLAGNEAKLGELQTKLSELTKEADALRISAAYKGGHVCPCPACGERLAWSTVGVLQKAEDALPKTSPPLAAKALGDVQAEIAQLQRQISTVQQSVADGRAAAGLLANLPKAPEPGAVREAENAYGRAQAALVVAQTDLRAVVNAEQEAERAEERTLQAAKYHADVLAFIELATALADLPAKYLAKAMKSVQDLLDEGSTAFGTPVTLGADMELRYGDVYYGMASESQQWRMLAAIGYAMAVMGGLGVLVLDRFDMVQVRSRGAILKWLAQQQKVQVVLCATLKEAPKLPEPPFQLVVLDSPA